MRAAPRVATAAVIGLLAIAAGAATAHGAPSTITATPTPFTSTEQVDFTQPGLGGCSVPPPPVFQGCTAPQADCNFFGIDAARFQSSRAGASGGDFSISASFSDGATGAGIIQPLSGGRFTAVVEHPAFPEPTSLTANVTIVDNVDNSSATVTTPITITERVIRANGCQDRSVAVGTPFKALPVAIVLDSEQGTPDVSATIAWGDGSASAGTWQPTDRYPYADLVTGSHAYASAGRYQVTVTLVEPEDASSRAQTTTNVVVANAVPVPTTGAATGRTLGGVVVVFFGLSLIAAILGAGRLRRRERQG